MPNLGVLGRKINAREVDPNPHILFTSVLGKKPNPDQALRMMKALAAQVRPLMQRHGIKVNSFEEYPFNKVFAGRNWNAGEVVELVLRRPDGTFLPMGYLERVLAHELAHCHQMNHGPAFQALWTRLQGDIRKLQHDGYFGDGFYSEGRRLGDSQPISSSDRAGGQVPELVCGGANKRSAPSRASRGYGGGGKRRRGQPLVNRVASISSGAQTAKKRKTSRANKKAFEDKEGGNRLDGLDDPDLPDAKSLKARINASAKAIQLADGGSLAAAKREATGNLTAMEKEILEGTFKGKRARTKSAAELRAEAAERRIKALSAPQASTSAKPEPSNTFHEDEISDRDDEEDELDELDDPLEAEFGPDAVKTMIGRLGSEERDAMRGEMEDEQSFVKQEGEDLGPCGTAATLAVTDYTPLRRPLKRDPEEHDYDRHDKQARRDIAPRQIEPRDQRETSLVKTEPKESSSSTPLSGTNRWISSPLPPAPTLPAEFRRPITHVTQPGSRSSAASDDPTTSSTAPVPRPKDACQEPAPRQSLSSGASVNPSSPWHVRPPAIHPADTWSGPGPNPYLFTARLPFETNILDTVKRVAAPGKPNEPSLSSDSLPVLPHERRAMIRKIAFHTGTTIRTGSDRCSQCQLSDTPAPPGWVRYPCTAVDPDWKKTKHRFHKCIACIFSGSLCDAVDEHQHGPEQKQANPFALSPTRMPSSSITNQQANPIELPPDRAPSSWFPEPQGGSGQDSRSTASDPAFKRVDPSIRTESSVEAKGPQPSSRLDLECGEHIYSCQGLARRIQTVVKYLEDRDLSAASDALAIIEKQSGNMREELDKLEESRRR